MVYTKICDEESTSCMFANRLNVLTAFEGTLAFRQPCVSLLIFKCIISKLQPSDDKCGYALTLHFHFAVHTIIVLL